MYEYLEPTWLHERTQQQKTVSPSSGDAAVEGASNTIDRTVKQYIGGKQARPDSGYSFPVFGRDGKLVGEAPLGNRKDIRNAVEAAHKADKWAKTPAHTRAQILYYIAENLIQRRSEMAARLAQFVGEDQASGEVECSIDRIFSYAAWADKYDGAVHNPPMRNVTLAMHEAIGAVGIVCPTEAPLLAFLSLVMPAIAAGNTVVAIPSEAHATILGDLYQVFDTSDLPGGVVNIVAGRPAELARTLAEHDDIDAIWCFRDAADATLVKAASIGNLKQVWTNDKYDIDWFDTKQNDGRYFMRHATQIKNIWVPYGE
jgi:aldehyde dehydrogenase (NAD+)